MIVNDRNMSCFKLKVVVHFLKVVTCLLLSRSFGVFSLFLALDEELSLDSEDTGESGCEEYMSKVQHGENCHA